MSKQIKIVEQCARCPRPVERTVTLEEAINLAKASLNKDVEPKKAMVILLEGEVVASYDFVCDPCRDIICSYLDGAAKKPMKKSAKRVVKAKKKGPPVATPPTSIASKK